MNSDDAQLRRQTIPARDGFLLDATVFPSGGDPRGVVVISSATAVPQRFYRHFAATLAAAGYAVVTYDYRGIGGSRPDSLRGFDAKTSDWALLDMAGVIDWVNSDLDAASVFLIGHSVGGQLAGLLDNSASIAGMVTVSAQSGHWRLQGAEQKFVVALHVFVTLPLLAHVFGYMPWSWISPAEDLPKGVALEWSRWCRDPQYVLGDRSLPLARYADFKAPVLAYSIDDDKWGTARSVDAMMSAYPNLERRHLVPAEQGLESLGHFGYFRPDARALWDEVVEWLHSQS